MRKYSHQKAYGQNYLRDVVVIKKILDHAALLMDQYPDAQVLEIGPGDGALTFKLSELSRARNKNFYVMERDRELAGRWARESAVFKLFEGDAAQASDEIFTDIGPCVVVSNLPYSAATAICLRLLAVPFVKQGLLMVQEEVGKKFRAGASDSDRGSLSVVVQNLWEMRPILRVPGAAFDPAPKVMSEVFEFVRRPSPLIPLSGEQDQKLFDELLRTFFSHRRKMISSNVKSNARWKRALEQSGVVGTLRAQDLDFEDWKKIWDCR